MQIMPDWHQAYGSMQKASDDIGFTVHVGWNFAAGDSILVTQEWGVVHVYVWNGRDAVEEWQQVLALPKHRVGATK